MSRFPFPPGWMTGGISAACLLVAAVLAATPDAPIAPPVRNWVLPIFTKEGYRSLILRGSSMRQINADRLDVVDMNITKFTGAAVPHVDSVLLSPAATFFLNEKTARGDQSVRLIRDDLEVTGEKWTYDYHENKVSIARHAHVAFQAPMPDILK